jgi:hypothetical protein
VTCPNDGGVDSIAKSELFNHVYKVEIDIVDVGKTSSQHDDFGVQEVYDGR